MAIPLFDLRDHSIGNCASPYSFCIPFDTDLRSHDVSANPFMGQPGSVVLIDVVAVAHLDVSEHVALFRAPEA